MTSVIDEANTTYVSKDVYNRIRQDLANADGKTSYTDGFDDGYKAAIEAYERRLQDDKTIEAMASLYDDLMRREVNRSDLICEALIYMAIEKTREE